MKPLVCEECGKPPDFRGLRKHHVIFRSQGGKNGETIYLCGKCHSKAHNIREVDSKPMWGR